MEFQNSYPLQRAPILGGIILYKFTNPKTLQIPKIKGNKLVQVENGDSTS